MFEFNDRGDHSTVFAADPSVHCTGQCGATCPPRDDGPPVSRISVSPWAT